MAGHGEKEMDVTNASRGIWLVKIPKFIKERWDECPGDVTVGKLKISRFPGSKNPQITYTMNETLAGSHSFPTEHKFIMHDIKQSLGVFAQPKVYSETSPDKEVPGASTVSLEGQVTVKFECQPVMNKKYLSLRKQTQEAMTMPARKTIIIDRPALTYKPKSYHEHKVVAEKLKEAEGKKSRDSKEEVMDRLFKAFEAHQYYNIKDLQKITRQPITYLKEILKEICNYNAKAPHRNTWELKHEYRHYTDKNPESKASSE